MAEFKLGRIRFVWKNDWVSSTIYYVDDVVLVNGRTYICVTGHTSLSDFNLDLATNKWEMMTDGQSWRNNWLASTQYQIGDLVKYGARVYICITGHMSQSSLELDQSKWDVFATSSFDWKSDWTISTYYKVGDLVKYGAGLYICTEGHTSANTTTLGLEDDSAKWDTLNLGFDYKGTWTGATRYKLNDVVKQGGGLWLSTIGHTADAADFTVDSANWVQFVEGLEFEDSWNIATAYQAGDIVNYGGYQYAAITNHTGTTPTAPGQTDWDLFSTGFNFEGDYNNATNYQVGDVVRVGGYTYLCVSDVVGTRPPSIEWERLNSGQYWKGNWADGTYYDTGDLVRYANSSYICISEHTSDETVEQNRPDQDLVGSVWNQLVGGAETTVLTTDGDIVYYSGAGPARLPIGNDGEVLKVDGSNLSWSEFGKVNNVFYVSIDGGANALDYGYTLDKPFASVRYACERVEDGHNSTGTKQLLQLNRSFMGAEIGEWVDYQIANATPGDIWDGFTQDDKVKCIRDIGQITDALAWDISHGGNVRTRAAALSYFNGGSLVVGIQDEYEQLAASLVYLKELIDAVISNAAPAVNYQTTNGVVTPITQQIDATLKEKADDQGTLNNLLNIIIDALNDQAPTDIPAEIKANNTIFVKTGLYKETLPMSVPEGTAVVGDELRSTRIEPAGSLVAPADVPYSLDAIDRLRVIIGDIAQNVAITADAGNAESQVTTRPAGAAAAGTAAQSIVLDIYNYIDDELNAAGSPPTLAGTNTPQTHTDYTFAVECIEANRTFIVAEILAYIATTYPAYVYDTEKCARDVNRYIDAIKYDLIYTGNYRALTAAKLYVNAVNGSLEQDMFYLRDGCGLRNCTIAGLTGTLGAANSYGTSRPSAGSYTSLDPGWGPNDDRVWINTRSPYVQNVTTFGTACVGCKVDGDLHAGGNDSIVANDFTQVLSDGIGYWVTNLGRAELVSVFCYYNHIGYLSENGGKIRATNGNNSYSDFGSVAEGVDSTETPITGTVNNRAYEAQVGRVFTDSSDILVVEYRNAGTAYTTKNNVFDFTGIGYDQDFIADEIRDDAISEIRMLTVGEDYRQSENTAQTGTTTSITLAGSETAPSSAYVGMRVFIKTGQGAGQYGYVNTYNSGTKVATILRESDDAPGWDQILAGKPIVAPNSASTYSVEPRVTVSAPDAVSYNGGSFPTGANNTTDIWTDVAYGDDVWVAVSNTSTATAVSAARGTWTPGGQIFNAGGAAPASMDSIEYGNIGGTGYFVTLPTATGTAGAYSADSGATWNAMTLPASADWVDIAFDTFNEEFIAISAAGDVALSTDGTTWTGVTNLPSIGSSYTALGYGLKKFVALAAGANNVAYTENSGTSWTTGITTPSSSNWSSIAFGNGRFIAVATGTNAGAYSLDGVTWYASTLPASADWSRIAYGQGSFLAIDNTTGQVAATTQDALKWTSSTLTYTNNHRGVAFGNPGAEGTFVVVGGDGTNAVAQYQKNATPAFVRAQSQSGQLSAIRIIEPGSGYTTTPTLTVTDPSNTVDGTWTVRTSNGALAQPNWLDRGQDWENAECQITGDGYADMYQDGRYVNVEGLSDVPQEGANITFAGNSTFYKLVNVTGLLGNGPYTATLQLSPEVSIPLAPEHGDALEVRIRYSQVRLTGHDFLDIGTGSFGDTNYPNTPAYEPDATKETSESGGGRVFYTSTDQDGNFRVGELFSVEQATGKSTLNADAFNLAGLQELQLGTVTLGSSNTAINEFSTDGTFAANSDSIVPTQKAIRTYIQSQIGGGGSNLNVNSVQAGSILISLNSISHVEDGTINIVSKANFKGGISGTPLALNYLLSR